MYNAISIDKDNKNKGLRISFVVHAILVLLIFFYYLPATVDPALQEDKPPYAVKVDFKFEESSMSKLAHDDEGVSRAKSESAPMEEKKVEEIPQPQEVVKPEEINVTKPQVIETPKPDIKIPKPVFIPTNDPVIVSTTPVEEAPVKVSPPSRPTTTEPVKPTVPATTTTSGNTTGSTTGTSTAKPSTVDGKDGTGKGDSGTGAGRDKGNDGDSGLGNSSDGTGAYDGSGNGIFGRKITYRNVAGAKSAISVSGRVYVKVCINRAGIVTFGEIIPSESTITDSKVCKEYLKVAKAYKFQPDPTAPKEECGKLIFTVDNSINNKLRITNK
jgi:outer membrane biosynthesis protein TonB